MINVEISLWKLPFTVPSILTEFWYPFYIMVFSDFISYIYKTKLNIIIFSFRILFIRFMIICGFPFLSFVLKQNWGAGSISIVFCRCLFRPYCGSRFVISLLTAAVLNHHFLGFLLGLPGFEPVMVRSLEGFYPCATVPLLTLLS
jgi:hypothetical protein